MREMLNIPASVFFGALGILLTFGTTVGVRAPDVIYGNEMNFPEGIILLFVSIELFRKNTHMKVFAVLLVLLNGIASRLDIWILARPVALSWVGIWISVFAFACWSSMKIESSMPKVAVKSA